MNPTDNQPTPQPEYIRFPSRVVLIFRAIWMSPTLREGGLMVVSSVAVTLALQLTTLINLLDTDPAPLNSLAGWVGSTFIAIVLTAVKQGAVWGVLKLGRFRTA